MAAPKIKVLLIEDSGFMRILLSDLIRADEQLHLVATAMNGLEGVQKAIMLRPDVVVTDMVMPYYDGYYVVKTLMEESPIPIVLLSSLDRDNHRIFDALKEGAFDFVEKPQVDEIIFSHPRLLEVIKEASNSSLISKELPFDSQNTHFHSFSHELPYDILAIGASTGGPGAVEFFINHLPENLKIPVLIGQHMPTRFIDSFATRLCQATQRRVEVASPGMPLKKGIIYLATADTNLKLITKKGQQIFEKEDTQFKEFNSPSIDSLFFSIAEVYGSRAVGVILTGMGKDGAAGLLKMKNKGALTIAQDQTSSIVFGMPREAIESGAASHVLPLSEIPAFIISAM